MRDIRAGHTAIATPKAPDQHTQCECDVANKIILSYRYRVKKKNAKALDLHASACNLVWNFCVNTQKHAKSWWKRWPTHFDICKLSIGVAAELGLQSDTISMVAKQFTLSRDQRRKCPRYRGKDSLGWVPFSGRAIRVDGSTVVYKRTKYHFYKSRDITGKVKGGSFSQDARGRWYINVMVEQDCIEQPASGEIGIDLGLKTLATLSNGESIANPRHFRQYEQKLATAQRAGKKKRARAIHAKIKNARKHHLHVTSTRLAKTYGRIVVGNVNSGKLAKTRMAKSVLDAGWSSFRAMLAYKTRLRGGTYVEGDERYSSQVCSACNSRTGPKGVTQLGVRNWVCVDCGSVHDRDHNAALNILRFAAEHRRPVAGRSSPSNSIGC